MSSKLKIILTSFIFVIGSLPFAQSGEINVPGFTGSINTTVTSGFSMRTDRNCLSVRGSKSLGSSDTGGAYAAYVAANHSSNSAAFFSTSPTTFAIISLVKTFSFWTPDK